MKIKNLFKIALVLFTSISMTNCTKETVNPEQNPLSGYLAATGFDQVSYSFSNVSDYEFGLSFKPMVNGKITAILVKIPDVRLGLKVTIWDVATATILRTELMDITSSGVEMTKTISALTLEKDKEYMITMNTNDYTIHRKSDSSNAAYPFTVGDISITGFSEINGALQQMPTTFALSYCAGDLSFKFQKS